ncbi:hypothetical protein Syn7502_00913 [Synechococcus sp. PCC 7502]|uniref:hypothetical protein n=1 Tax=Synechococcus sp. PCC 7502 TaxID=1173263 RepID=UPI00029F8DFB|nr:hypothetical protein [Synechococcus sp. PCC 7502]AFY73033.1 hypothetical protein Syn7502_00913 [Synechococcus sp. PCC 7502]
MYQIGWVGKGLVIGLCLMGISLPAIAETSVSPSGSSITNDANNIKNNEDIPEEVLRTEIYTEARSPVDGSLLSAAEYIELGESLKQSIENIPPRFLVSDKLQYLIDLLKLRKLIRQVVPFF